MIGKTVLLLFLLLNSPAAFAEDIVLNGRECEDKLAALIAGAKKYIDISMYSINNKRLTCAVIDAFRRGVRVRILTDKVQASGKTSRVQELRRAGIPLRINTHKRIMHTKVAIYDGISVSTGSLNWTEPAVTRNEEVCDIFIDRPDYAEQHQRLFDERWKKNTQEKSDLWFQERQKKYPPPPHHLDFLKGYFEKHTACLALRHNNAAAEFS